MVNFLHMKIKLSKEHIALITLASTLVVTTAIDLIVAGSTNGKRERNYGSSQVIVNEHAGNKLYASLLEFAEETTTKTYPNSKQSE